MKTSTWTHNEIFPIIDHVIRAALRKNRNISSWNATWELLADAEAKTIIDAALRARGWKIPRGRLNADQRAALTMVRYNVAINMVAWFNARWTRQELYYEPKFGRVGYRGRYGFTKQPKQ